MIIQLATIEESKKEPDQSYLTEILSLAEDKQFSKKLQKWYNSEIKKTKMNSDMIEYQQQVDSALEIQGYTVEQRKYTIKMIGELFKNGTKRDKNDAEDFWFLGASKFGSYLLTFDNEIISILEEVNHSNFQYINQFKM
jgi:hypothetical protein